jgi:hypothetical protein
LDLPPLIDRRLIDRRLIDRRLIDRRLIDRQLIDRQLIHLLIDRKSINQQTIDRPRQLIDPYNWSTPTIAVLASARRFCWIFCAEFFVLNFLAKIFSFYFVPTYLLQAYFWG